MKAMTKQQLADAAGVSRRTIYNWLRPQEDELRQIGYKPKMMVLPPNITAWIAEKFGIDV
jgi:DNA-binding XRE family transcriptional regulator